MIRQIVVSALLACAAMPAVHAQAEEDAAVESSALLGEWSFIANTDEECSFTGTALLTRTEDENRFGCELTALQMCSVETWQVRQSCSAVRVGDQLVINSTIEEFLQGQPDGRYRPDNFSLMIKSADYMRGVLISWGSHIAEFRRADGTIS